MQLETSVKGVFEWEILNTETGEVRAKGTGNNHINPQMLYYGFNWGKDADTEYMKHNRVARYAKDFGYAYIHTERTDPEEYVNNGYDYYVFEPSNKRFEGIKISGSSRNSDIALVQDTDGEVKVLYTTTFVFAKGIPGTYKSLMIGYHNNPEYPSFWSVFNPTDPIELSEIDQLTITYKVWMKPPRTLAPVSKQVEVDGKMHTMTWEVFPPKKETRMDYRTGLWHSELFARTVVSEGNVYFEDVNLLKHYRESTFYAVSFNTETGVYESGTYIYTKDISRTNVSEPYPAPLKISHKFTITIDTVGKIQRLFLSQHGSAVMVTFDPPIDKTNEQELHLETIITYGEINVA